MPTQNGRHLAVDHSKRIFLNENNRISIEISLEFLLEGPISIGSYNGLAHFSGPHLHSEWVRAEIKSRATMNGLLLLV